MKLERLLQYKIFALILSIFSIIATVLLFSNIENRQVIGSDGIGYYSYLPAVFIDNDLSFTKVVNRYEERFNEKAPEPGACLPGNLLCDEFIGLKPQQNGIYINKYPVGEAILMFPFFLGADVYVQLTNGIRDGISTPYQLAIALSGLIYLQLGSYLSYLVLRYRFNKLVAFITMIILLLGTNIVHYAVYEPSMSHIYSYTMITLGVFLLDRYLRSPSHKLLLFLCFDIAMIALLRNLNILFTMIPLLTILINTKKGNRLRTGIQLLLYMSMSLLIFFIPQFLYWKFSTGNFIAYGYLKESFNLLEPHLLEVLFEMQANGLFFWHPLLLLIIPGSYYWLKSKESMSRISLIFLVIFTYLISCWWAYWFGYAFGHRAFTDYYIFFFIPIGYFINSLRYKNRNIKILITIIIAFLLYLNLVQMNNYWRGIVSSFNYSWQTYCDNFLDPNIDLDKWINKILIHSN